MVLVASLEAVVLLAVIYLFMRHHTHSEQAWTEERRELLSRIQRPDQVPLHVPENFVFPEPEPDEIDQVGTITFKED